MRHFTLLIGTETRGPFSEVEIEAQIAAGTLPPTVRCAEAGQSEWSPLSQHFSFGTNLVIRRTKPVATPAEAAADERIDPANRKRLLAYGLADAGSIDGFTQVQARQAIADHETRLRGEIGRSRLATWTAGIASCLVAIGAAWVDGPVGDMLTGGAAFFIPQAGHARATHAALRQDLAAFAGLKASVDRIAFEPPTGGRATLGVIADRAGLDPARAFALNGRVDLSPLGRRLARWEARLGPDRQIHVLPAPPAGQLRELLDAQTILLNETLGQPLDEAGFATLFAKAMASFPSAPFAEAAALRSAAEAVRRTTLTAFVERVDRQVTLSDGLPDRRRWSLELRHFAAQLRTLDAAAAAAASPERRRQRWLDFHAGPGARLVDAFRVAGAVVGRLSPEGEFAVEGVGALNARTLAAMVVSVEVNGARLFLPWGDADLGAGAWRCEPLGRFPRINAEPLRVAAKSVVGGRAYHARYSGATHEFVITRNSPRWYYLALTRTAAAAGETPLFLLVTPALQASAQTGALVKAGDLASFDCFAEATESPAPPLLRAD